MTIEEYGRWTVACRRRRSCRGALMFAGCVAAGVVAGCAIVTAVVVWPGVFLP